MFIFKKTRDKNNNIGYDEIRIMAFNVDGEGGALVQYVDRGSAMFPQTIPWFELEPELCGYYDDDDDEFVEPSYQYKGDI